MSSKVQKTNSQESVTNSNNTSKKPNKRIISSIVIILLLFPLFLIPGLNSTPMWCDYIFITFLSIGFLYSIYEVVNFVFSSDVFTKEKFIIFLLFVITFFIIFLVNEINFVKMQEFANTLIWLVFSIICITAITSSMENVKISDIFILNMVVILLMLFFMSLTLLTISSSLGWKYIFLFIFIVAFTDIMAYYGGNLFGKTKAFPTISPNKTVEGLVIGIAFGIAFGLIFFFSVILPTTGTFLFSKSIYFLLFIIPMVALIAPFGDLTFSKIKRHYKGKDFSNLIPGHGGFIDRIDSHIIAITFAATMISIIYM